MYVTRSSKKQVLTSAARAGSTLPDDDNDDDEEEDDADEEEEEAMILFFVLLYRALGAQDFLDRRLILGFLLVVSHTEAILYKIITNVKEQYSTQYSP